MGIGTGQAAAAPVARPACGRPFRRIASRRARPVPARRTSCTLRTSSVSARPDRLRRLRCSQAWLATSNMAVGHQLLRTVAMRQHPFAADEERGPDAVLAQKVDDPALIAGNLGRLLAKIECQRDQLLARRKLDPSDDAALGQWRVRGERALGRRDRRRCLNSLLDLLLAGRCASSAGVQQAPAACAAALPPRTAPQARSRVRASAEAWPSEARGVVRNDVISPTRASIAGRTGR